MLDLIAFLAHLCQAFLFLIVNCYLKLILVIIMIVVVVVLVIVVPFVAWMKPDRLTGWLGRWIDRLDRLDR